MCMCVLWRNGRCKKVDEGQECLQGMRLRQYHVLCGALLCVWKRVADVVADITSSSILQIVRLKTREHKQVGECLHQHWSQTWGEVKGNRESFSHAMSLFFLLLCLSYILFSFILFFLSHSFFVVVAAFTQLGYLCIVFIPRIFCIRDISYQVFFYRFLFYLDFLYCARLCVSLLSL